MSIEELIDKLKFKDNDVLKLEAHGVVLTITNKKEEYLLSIDDDNQTTQYKYDYDSQGLKEDGEPFPELREEQIEVENIMYLANDIVCFYLTGKLNFVYFEQFYI